MGLCNPEYFPLVGVKVLNISQINLLQEKVKTSAWHIWNETAKRAWELQQEGRGAAQSIQNRENGSADKGCLLWKQSSYAGEGFHCCRVHSREGDVDGAVIVSHFWKVSALVVLWCLMAESVPFWMGNWIKILRWWQQIMTPCEFRKGSSPPWLETNSNSTASVRPSTLRTRMACTYVVGALGTIVGSRSTSVILPSNKGSQGIIPLLASDVLQWRSPMRIINLQDLIAKCRKFTLSLQLVSVPNMSSVCPLWDIFFPIRERCILDCISWWQGVIILRGLNLWCCNQRERFLFSASSIGNRNSDWPPGL